MFRIVDGREHFYQWDLDRQVTVDDSSIIEVHFCNRTDECSLVVDVVDGKANVPNIILQNSFDIRVFGYDGKATLHEKTFKVKARTQPSDYVYTETTVKRIDEVLAKAEEAAELASTTANELYEYVEGHKLTLVDDGKGNVTLQAVATGGGDPSDPADLSNYYTKAQTEALIDEAIEGIEIPEVPEVDLTGYATEKYVDDKIDAIPEVDLSEYAKKSEIPDTSSFISAIPEEYVTETELTAKGYLTEHQSLDGYAKTTDIPDVSGYQTEAQVIALIQANMPASGDEVSY